MSSNDRPLKMADKTQWLESWEKLSTSDLMHRMTPLPPPLDRLDLLEDTPNVPQGIRTLRGDSNRQADVSEGLRIAQLMHPLPDPQCRCEVVPMRCRCGQTAMDGYSRCADCQMDMERGMGGWAHKPLRGLTQPEQKRPDRVLGEWVMRPCGTIADGKIR